MYFDWLLVRGISLPAAQLFVIAIENILRGSVGNLTGINYLVPYSYPMDDLVLKAKPRPCSTRRLVRVSTTLVNYT